MRTENYLWFLDVTDNACIMSLNYEELKGMIGTMISPGEEPPEIEADEEVEQTISKAKMKAETKAETESINKDRENPTTPKFCRNCGEKLSIGSKFCKKCGNKI